MCFARNIGKNISKNFIIECSLKRIDHAKQSATDLPVSKRAIQKTAEATGDLIWNKNADRITKVSKT